MPRFAANLTMMFNEVPLAERFAAAASAGFDAVEVLFPYELAAPALVELLSAAGLSLVLINAPAGDWGGGERGLAVLPGREEEFRAGIATAKEYAAAADVPRVHVMSGLAPPDDAAALARWRDRMAEAADSLGAAGLEMLLEPLNGRDVPGYFLDDFDRTAELIAGLGRANVRLQFDIYHRQILHGDVITGLRRYAGLIGHVQIAGVPERNEPGTGELDDRRVLRELEAVGYEGWVGCEYKPAGRTEDGLGWLARARET